jgi:hypothetical protein
VKRSIEGCEVLMNPFSQPKNYNEMLTKIMVFNFCVSLVFVAVVAHDWPTLWNFLHPSWLTFNVDVLGLKNVPTAYLIVAFLISLAARISKLHDKVSDVFGIRGRFDLHEILTPLAGGVGIPVDFTLRERLIQRRNQIMGDIFYRYASSTDPAIDKHLIWKALDKWSWFWICIEGTTVGTVAFILLLSVGAFRSATFVGAIIFVGTLAATQINRACASAAQSEVREILRDAQRCTYIEAALRAL